MALDKETILRTLRKVDSLPTLPQIYERISSMADHPGTSAGDLGKVIAEDQALAARLLKLVNSAFYGFPGKIGSITRAIVILGFDALKQLVLSTSVMGMFGKVADGPLNLSALWQHGMATATLAKTIARRTGLSGVEEVFVGGLLHDIGKLVGLQQFPQAYQEVLERVPQPHRQLAEAEREVLGLDHAEIGAWVATRWKLPEGLVEMIGLHHRPREAARAPKETAIVQLADALAIGLGWGSGGSRWVGPVDPECFARVGATADQLGRWLADAEREYREIQAIMEED